MTPCFNARIGGVGWCRPTPRRGGLDAFLLGQRTEAFDDFAIRIEDCEDLRDLRMPLAV